VAARNLRFFSLLLVMALLLAAVPVSPVSGGVEEARQEVEELQEILEMLDKNIKDREQKIKELKEKVQISKIRLQEAEEALAEAEENLDEQNRLFAERVRSAYMKGGLSYLEVILAAEDFGDLITRLVYLSRIFKRDATVVAGLREEYALMKERRVAMEREKEELEDLQYRAEAEYKNLMAETKTREDLLAAAEERLAEELAKIPQAERKPVYALVIDNHSSARPHYGLSQANVIYEYEVEGGITRYLALFAEFPAKVGPLRSARQHSMILALENGVRYVHAGGSHDNLVLIKDLGVKNTDALTSSSKHFYRDSARKAPHNLFVNLQALGVEKQSTEKVLRPAYLDREGQKKNSLSVSCGKNYTVSYKYDAENGCYYRYINGKQDIDRGNGEAIKARNIIIQYTPYYNDSRGRPTAKLVGEGTIDFYSQGQYFRGTWRKESESAPTRYFYQNGREIERVYGQTWIHIVRK